MDSTTYQWFLFTTLRWILIVPILYFTLQSLIAGVQFIRDRPIKLFPVFVRTKYPTLNKQHNYMEILLITVMIGSGCCTISLLWFITWPAVIIVFVLYSTLHILRLITRTITKFKRRKRSC